MRQMESIAERRGSAMLPAISLEAPDRVAARDASIVVSDSGASCGERGASRAAAFSCLQSLKAISSTIFCRNELDSSS